MGEYGADRAVGFVNGAIGLDTDIVLGDAAAVTKSRCTVITRARVYFAEPFSHVRRRLIAICI
jgi:hypothetical protein